MGSSCSTTVVNPEKYKRISNGPLSFTHFKRDDADEVLEKAPSGYYLFSQDAAGEKFLSVSVGSYVCHHPIFKQGMLLTINGECFVSINQVLDFYTIHPLGKVKLTKQFDDETPVRKISTISTIHQDEISVKKKSTDGIVVNNNSKKKKKKPPKKDLKVSFHIQPIILDKKKEKVAIDENAVDTLVNDVVEETKKEQQKCSHAAAGGCKNKIFPEVSSADEKEHIFGDEPIPVLPAPTGIRPPPLFQKFSLLLEEFSDPFNAINLYLDPKQMLFQLYKGNPRLQYAPRVNLIKLIVTGQADTYEERRYFITHHVNKLKEWSNSYDYYLEYIDLMLDHGKSDLQNNKTWIHEQLCNDINNEIKRCVDGNIPFILLVYTGQQYGNLRVPEVFRDQHFEDLLESINKDDAHVVKMHYVKDENSIPCSYVLSEKVKADETKTKLLADIFKRFTMAENFLENLWGYFIPGRDLHTRTVLKCANPFVLFVRRSFYDLDSYSTTTTTSRYNNEYETSQLEYYWRKSKCFYEHCLLNNNLEAEDQMVAYETSFGCFFDLEKTSQHCQKFCDILIRHVKSSIISIQALIESKSVKDLEYDEVLYHILASKKILKNSIVHEEMLLSMKKYIEDFSPTTLVVHGGSCCGSCCGKSSLLSRCVPHAFEFFNGLCCIVCRYISHTPDSSSFSLLLRSICLQLSYAYGTDPNAVPNSVNNLTEHFFMLLELATDSLPLIVILDSLDLLQDFSTNEQLILSILANELPPYVKIIVSVNSKTLEKINSEFVVELAHPVFTEEYAFKYLDHMLVEKDRTLNHLQKDLVATAILSNHEPVFIRMLIKEIEKWKSTSEPSGLFDSINAIEQLLSEINKPRIETEIIPPFVYAVALHRMGIPKTILVRFIKSLLERQQHSAGEIQNRLQCLLTRWSAICEIKVISGLEFVHIKDDKIYDLFLTRSHDNKHYAEYLEKMIETFHIFHKNYTAESRDHKLSMVKQKLMLVELSFFHRFLLHHGKCNDIKQFFALNFDYLSAKLTLFSFCHMSNEIAMAEKSYPEDYEIEIISEIIGLSKDALHQDKTQFPLQIICRLNSMDQKFNQIEITQSHFLQEMKKHCLQKCNVLKPSSPCLVIPKCLCGKDKEQQNSWKGKDLKLIFTPKWESNFLGWSAEKNMIYFYNKNCEILKTVQFHELNRILLTLKGKLVIETTTGKHILFDVDTKQCMYSFHQDYDVLAGNQIDSLVLWSNSNMKEVKVINTTCQSEVWKYESEVAFNNVCCSEDGSTMLCYSDYCKIQTVAGGNAEDVEQIDVLDLKRYCKVVTITLPAEASFSKLSALSEDGQYFLRMMEPDIHLLVWEITTGKLLHKIKTNCCQIVKLNVSSRGKNIVTVSTDASIRVFSLHDGALIHTLTKNVKSIRMDDQHCLSLSADGKFAIYYVKSKFYPSFIAVWNVMNGERLAAMTADFYGLNYQISPDCDYILSNFPSGLITFQLN